MRNLIACLSFVFAACAGPRAASAPCAPPVEDSDWATLSPRDAGFDGAALCRALEDVSDSEVNVHALLVERHGKLVAELYRAGPDRPFDRAYGTGTTDRTFDVDQLHDVRSITKTVTGLLAGIAAGAGQFPPLDANIAAELEPSDRCAGDARAVTVGQVLTMSTGLQWHEWGYGPLTSDEVALIWTNDVVRHVLDRPAEADAGTTFHYSGGNTSLVRLLIEQRSGKALDDFAKAALFDPLNIQSWVWVKDVHGAPLANGGLRLRPRDLLKLGRLLLDGGRWHGAQVVPETWVKETMVPVVATGTTWFSLQGEEATYGRQLWTGTFSWHGQTLAWVQGIGNGGQRVLVVPALDVTIGVTAGDYDHVEVFEAELPYLLAVLDAIVAE